MPTKKSDQRRSAFEEWVQERPERVQGQSAIPAPLTPMDLMGPEPKPTRNRAWEQKHRTYSYRGVPQDIREQVVALAEAEELTVDEVAQAFVEYGFYCIEKRKLTPPPARPKAQRMTIYPLPSGWGKLAGWSEADEWSPTPKKIPVKRKSSTRVKKGWQQLAHYRLSGEAHAAIKQLAEKNNVPLGEIVILLLKHGLESYKSGRLKFTPHLKVGKNTLAWDAS